MFILSTAVQNFQSRFWYNSSNGCNAIWKQSNCLWTFFSMEGSVLRGVNRKLRWLRLPISSQDRYSETWQQQRHANQQTNYHFQSWAHISTSDIPTQTPVHCWDALLCSSKNVHLTPLNNPKITSDETAMRLGVPFLEIAIREYNKRNDCLPACFWGTLWLPWLPTLTVILVFFLWFSTCLVL